MFKDLVEEYLTTNRVGCVVSRWITALSDEDRGVFEKLLAVTRDNNKAVDIKAFYAALVRKAEAEKLSVPFKLTAFRSHMRGYCTCR